MKEEHEQWKEACKKEEKKEMQHHNRVNKSFEKIPRFDGTNPAYCFDWLTQIEALVNDNEGRNYREELLFNCGISVTKMIQAVPQGASHQEIKDAVLRNHSDLRTPSQRSNAYQNLYQKPDEVLQTYNTRYSAYFGLAYPELDLDDPMTKMHCTHYTTSLYSKLGDEMTGRFNQELPRNLTEAFRKAMNFEPCIITKQSINDRKMHEVNHVDIGNYSEDIEVNKAHIRNPNYKGKNYDPNYQQNRNKQNANTNTSSTGNNYRNPNNQGNSFSKPNAQNNNSSDQGNNSKKTNLQDKPTNITVMLTGPVSKEQLYKIQEVLRHPSQYRDRLKPEDRPATGPYASTFNKFRPKKVEVNEATPEEAVRYGQYLKRSENNITKAIDIFRALGDDASYGPEELPDAEPQEEEEQ